jgi:NADH dehydrogenase
MYDAESIQRAVSRSTVVINLIGAHNKSVNWSYHDVHVKCAYRLAKISKEAGVPRFIHVSALGADEDSPSELLRTKAEGEVMVRAIFPESTILRPAPMFGREDHFLNRLVLITKHWPINPIIRGGGQKIQPVYVGDLAQAILNCVTLPGTEGKTYSVAGPEVFSYAELCDIVRRKAYRHMNMVNITEEAASVLGKLLHLVPSTRRIMSGDAFEIMKYDMVEGEKELTLKDLRVKPKPLAEYAEPALVRHKGARGPSRFGMDPYLQPDELHEWHYLEQPMVGRLGTFRNE